MAIDYRELEDWFQNRPHWIQDAARRVVQSRSLLNQDYTELLTICLNEAANQLTVYAGIAAGSLQPPEVSIPIRLRSISHVQGINALQPTKPLLLGSTALSIVYGRNGSGKSGYVRLLQHASGSRHRGELLVNVFAADPQAQSAQIDFELDGQAATALWSGQPIPELQTIDIYDTASGLVYVDEENEVTFEPWLLRLFTQLTFACEELRARINASVAALTSRKPALPPEFATTETGIWYNNINAECTAQEISQITSWTDLNENELQQTTARLAEPNPNARASMLRRQRTSLTQLSTDLRNNYASLDDEHCRTYLRVKHESEVRHRAAEEDSERVFAKAPLSGVGSESWRLLWEAARRIPMKSCTPTFRFQTLPKVLAACFVKTILINKLKFAFVHSKSSSEAIYRCKRRLQFVNFRTWKHLC